MKATEALIDQFIEIVKGVLEKGGTVDSVKVIYASLVAKNIIMPSIPSKEDFELAKAKLEEHGLAVGDVDEGVLKVVATAVSSIRNTLLLSSRQSVFRYAH